eukprot:48040_1
MDKKIISLTTAIIGSFVIWKAYQRKHNYKQINNTDAEIKSPAPSMHPLDVFRSWMKEYESRVQAKITSKFACLSTIQCNGNKPSSRMMSILDITNDFTFMFGTILSSNKVKEFRINPNVSLTFNYNQTFTSIRINGIVKQCDENISAKYWESRSKSYKMWALTTTQQKEIKNIEEFNDRLTQTTKQYDDENGKSMALPSDKWSVFEVIPLEVEFWRYGKYNLHLRHKYIMMKDKWELVMLDS